MEGIVSKLTRDEAKVQAARILASPMLSPQTKEGKEEIVNCFLRNCHSAEHAAAVMTEVLDSALKVEGPITAWIATVAHRTRRPEEAPPGCSRCEIGTDVDTGVMRWAQHVTDDSGYYSTARRCLCDRGRWLVAKDRARAAEAAKALEPRGMPNLDDWAAGDI